MAARRTNSAELKHAAFAARYLVNGGNGTEAAIFVGYSEKSAHSTASEILKDPKVQEIIEAAKAKLVKKAEVTLEKQLERLDNIAGADIRDIYEESGALKHPADWPDGVRLALAGFDVEELTEHDRDSKTQVPIGELKKFKFWDKVAAIDKIIKVLGGYAAEKTQVEVTVINHAERLRNARTRSGSQ